MLNFWIRHTASSGEVGVSINGVKYIYLLDAGFIPKVERLAKRSPGKALNFLKKVSRDYIKEGGDTDA
jgi:hypothetical protein